MNSRGITPDTLSLPKAKGGHSQTQTKNLTFWQLSNPFGQCSKSLDTSPKHFPNIWFVQGQQMPSKECAEYPKILGGVQFGQKGGWSGLSVAPCEAGSAPGS